MFRHEPGFPGWKHELGAWLSCGLALLLCACSAAYYKADADREAYGIIREKALHVPGMPRDFSIERTMDIPTAAQVAEDARNNRLPPLSLVDALLLAAANSRDFQDRREAVYRQALALSEARHDFSPQFAAAFGGIFEKDQDEERSIAGDSDFRMTRAFATGADLTLRLTSDFLRFITGDPRKSAESIFDITLTQPLWRGAGSRIALENLTQAERDMVYELRSFVQFRRAFFVDVANAYYQVLRQKNVVENERANMNNLIAARERAQMLGEAGRLPGFQVDQAEQDELDARDRWVQAVRSYENALDAFKIRLALPPDVPLELDYNELTRLMSETVPEFGHTREEAVAIALARRLDLLTAADRIGDAVRRIDVAENNLGPDLDLVLNAGIATREETKFAKFTRDRDYHSASLRLDLPLDRLAERNDYRTALITLDQRTRQYEELRDNIVEEILRGLRTLEEARNRHVIQSRSVALAERRVESTTLLIEAGRAEMRDLLEAQQALVRAQNALASTFVNYRIAALELWRDMETLEFRDGQFVEEKTNVVTETGN
jgi:outer membrane protein TolC